MHMFVCQEEKDQACKCPDLTVKTILVLSVAFPLTSEKDSSLSEFYYVRPLCCKRGKAVAEREE